MNIRIERSIMCFAVLVMAMSALGPRLSAQSLQAAGASVSWVTTISGASGNSPDAVVDTNGNYYVVAHFNSTNATVGGVTLTNSGTGFDTLLVKYNPQGQAQWVKQFTGVNSDFGLCAAYDPAGAIYVSGNFYSPRLSIDGLSVTNSTTNSYSDIFIAKFDLNGNALRLQSIGGNNTDTAFTLAIDSRSNLIVAGSFFSSTIKFGNITLNNIGDSDIFIAKYDANGGVIWAQHAGSTKADSGYSLSLTSGDGFFLSGYYRGAATFGSVAVNTVGNFDAYLAKYDSNGNCQWVATGGGTGTDESFRATSDSSGNGYYCGMFNSASATFGSIALSGAGNYDAFIVKVSSAGQTLWAKSIGGPGDDEARGLATDSFGNVYVSGYFSTNAAFGGTTPANSGGGDIFVAKYDPNGNLQWFIPMGGGSDDSAEKMFLDSRGSAYLMGYCSSNAIFGNFTLANSVDKVPYFARIDFPLPALALLWSGDGPALSWHTNEHSIIAQTTADLTNPQWHDLTNLPAVSNGFATITNLSVPSPSFFRLRQAN